MEHLMRDKLYAKLVSCIQLPKIIRISSGVKKAASKPSHEIFVAFKGCPNFDPRNILGASVEVCENINYGTTYKATMEDGKIMLVNKLKDVMLEKKELKQLVDSSQRIPQHPNVMPLLAYYYSEGYMLQIYDNMNGTTGSGGRHLSWDSRLKISLGVARGIAHIHYNSPKGRKIVHGNITSSNVLVGRHLQTCILHPLLTPLANLSKNKGYQAPEVIETGKITGKSDVYSFGILLLEMLTGKSALEYGNLPGYVEDDKWDRLDGIPFHGFFDATIVRGMSDKGYYYMMTLAMDCVERVPTSRPLMDAVVSRIEDMITSN
ncbi:hypothetical protein TanjilG_10599 [Lupinus angustifolius]|uniref:Protein kinase domain-containing protein n=1 Tax=Lupinus angustifolius TaxID=3871 RepID=A0A4P1RVQ3_LUPAN|nr:hypothetical protein TanjilG_10599 [Lupinus angustifolius]